MRLAATLGIACALAFGPAHGQPFTVEDLLSLQDLGRTAFSPDGRWLVMDVAAPWKAATHYDLDALTYLSLGRPMIVDLTQAGDARPLMPFEAGAGYTTGAFSPDGQWIVVYRQRDKILELGVAPLGSGQTWWSGIEVDPEVFTATARWAGPDQLVVLSRSAEDSRVLSLGWVHQDRSTRAWAEAAAGRVSGVAMGSGRYRDSNPPPPSARLLLVEPRLGKVQTLAEGAFADMTMSSNGERVALVEDAEPIPSGLEAPSAFKSSQRRRLVLVDLKSGRRARPCPRCDLARLPIAWSDDGRTVLAAARLDGPTARFGYWALSFYGRAEHLAPHLETRDSVGRDPSTVGGVAWLDGLPVVLAGSVGRDRSDWWRLGAKGPVNLTAQLPAGAGPAIAVDQRGLLLPTASGVSRLTADGRMASLAAPGARLILSAVLPGDRPVAAASVVEGAAHPIWPETGPSWPMAGPPTERVLDVVPKLGLTAGLTRDVHGVKSVVLRGRSGDARTVLTLNPQLAAFQGAVPVAVAAGPSGSPPRTSWLYLPVAERPETPLIVLPYPGSAYAKPPADAEPGALGLVANIQVLTSAGFAVLVPSLPLAADADPGQGLAAAILAPVDAALAAHPSLSRTCLAIWGQSFGGWGALMAASQTDRFKAVIATSPITDLFSFYGHLGPQAIAAPDRYLALPSLYGWSETGQGRMLGPPWKDPDRNFRNSPALLTDKITAPVMLVTSDSDFTTGQSTPVFTSLYRQDKDALLLTYRGEGHVVMSPGNVRDLYARAFAFLADALGPAISPSAGGDTERPSQCRTQASTVAATSSVP